MVREIIWRRKNGFTLMELLIVVAIIVLILLLIFINMRTMIKRAHDAQRKTDISRIQKSFEEYINDKRCYPPEAILDTCGSTDLSPYLKSVPCDPVTKTPYLYVPGTPSPCGGYRICTKLEDTNDPDIARIGCHPLNGCGWGAGYNYCLSAGYQVTPEGFDPNEIPTATPTVTATPSPTPSYAGLYACTPGGSCNQYDNPALHGCPEAWAEPNCRNMCGNPAKRCAD